MGFYGVLSSTNKTLNRKEFVTARRAFITALILNILIGGSIIIITITEKWLPPIIFEYFGFVEYVTKIIIAIFHIIGWINFSNFLHSICKAPIPFLNISFFRTTETLLVLERSHNIIYPFNGIYRDYELDIFHKSPLDLPEVEITIYNILLIIEVIVLISQILVYFLYFKGSAEKNEWVAINLIDKEKRYAQIDIELYPKIIKKVIPLINIEKYFKDVIIPGTNQTKAVSIKDFNWDSIEIVSISPMYNNKTDNKIYCLEMTLLWLDLDLVGSTK